MCRNDSSGVEPVGVAVGAALVTVTGTPPRGSRAVLLDRSRWGPGPRGPGPPSSLDSGGRARRRVRGGADVFLLPEAVRDDVLDALLEDRLRRLQRRRDVGLEDRVLDLAGGDAGGVLALDQRDGQRCRGVGLLLDGLVDRHALVAGEDRLQALLA